jgi:hypothetical protein
MEKSSKIDPACLRNTSTIIESEYPFKKKKTESKDGMLLGAE